jgi:serine/threonine protein kinase
MSDSSSTPMSEETAYVAFLKDLDDATDPAQVIHDYAARYPHLAGEFEEMARVEQKLGHAQGREEPRAEHPTQLGDFRIIRPIAEGGMGTIYEAVQESLNRRVAVKTVRDRKQHLTGMFRVRFLREQKVLAQLHHTHIVPIHAAGHVGDPQYFAMSYIDGAALHHVVRTAKLHESSSHHNGKGKSAHTPTPTLAALAAEAKSSTPGSGTHDPNPAHDHGNGQPKPPDESTSTTALKIEPPPVATETTTLPPNGNGKLILSPAYFRSVARVMIDAAEAVQHAHEAGIIHRDLKPSNLMVDTSEHCWVLDFGLAGYLRAQANGEGSATAPPQASPIPDLGPDPPTVSGILGTPDYMAPEQFQGRADTRTDVWGLGVILYELLTLRRPFHDRESIKISDTVSPSDLVLNLPADLEAICAKAMRKEPMKRYQTPRELTDDLRRWVRHEPVAARPALAFRRAVLWTHRNPGWATALLLAVMAILGWGFAVSVIGIQMAATAEARAEVFRERGERAGADAQHKGELLVAAERVSQQRQHELLLQSIQQVRTSPHRDGWFEDVWGRIRKVVAEAGAGPDGDPGLQSQAAAALFGLEVRKFKHFREFGAAFLAIDSKGENLLLGCVEDPKRRGRFLRNQLVTDSFQRARDLAVAAIGPVAFRPDGTPVQLVPDEGENGKPDTLSLIDLNTGKISTRFELPAGKLGIRFFRQVGLSSDGTLAAAPVKQKDGRDSLMVWDAATGKSLKAFAWKSSAVSFSPDRTLVAAGDADGRINVWSLGSGEVIAQLGAGRTEVECLAFGRDYVGRPSGGTTLAGPRHGWLLAAGDHGAIVTIYDLERRQARSICRGSTNEIFNVAFSPDGSTLASCGRSMYLWDVATGRPLLRIGGADYAQGLAFTPDSRRLLVSSTTVWGSGSVMVLELDQNRGVQNYRGLTGLISQVRFSPDGRRLPRWHTTGKLPPGTATQAGLSPSSTPPKVSSSTMLPWPSAPTAAVSRFPEVMRPGSGTSTPGKYGPGRSARAKETTRGLSICLHSWAPTV